MTDPQWHAGHDTFLYTTVTKVDGEKYVELRQFGKDQPVFEFTVDQAMGVAQALAVAADEAAK
jgi:hypothetical protein